MPSRAARTLLCAALLAGSALGGTAPAFAGQADITGHVTDAATGAPLQACLSAMSERTWESVDTCTDESGAYSLPASGGDGWVVSADAQGYAHQYARGHYDWNSSDRLSAPGTADFAMVRASAVRATLRETSGDPVAWAWVEVVDPANGEQVGSGSSDDSGALDLGGVRAGDVLVHVSIGGRDVWLGGDGSRADAHTYTVPADAPLDLGEVTLPAATRIVGRLTDAAGAPVSGVCADASTGGWGWGCSDADGRYAVEVAPGANLVHLVSQNPDVASVWVGGAYAKASASTVTAVAHTDVVADQVMPRAARLEGRALDSDGNPVEGACPVVHLSRTPENAMATGDCSGADGTFHIASVPPTKVTVSLTSQHGVDTWAPGVAVQRHATLFRPVSGQTTAVGDVRLVAGKVVTGRVVDAVTGAPVPHVWVTDAYAPRAGGPVSPHAVQTDANGEYELSNLSGDTITLVAWDMSYDYAPTFSGDAPTEGRAVPVRLAAQPVTSDFALRRAGVLEATVTAADGSPLPGTWVVDAYGTDGASYGSSSDLYPAGDTSLTIRGLPEAPMKLKFTDPDSHQTFWYGGADEDSAQTVRVPAGQTQHLTITQPAS